MKWPFVLVASLLAGCSGAPAGSTTWHVDFESGSNRADGKTPATAWKHAPGDAEADGGPANVALKPGDTVLFRAGVPYRGSITIPASGTAEAPITYSGLGWGKGMGIIDGSDPVRSARPCTSAADCGGAEAWQGLHRIEFDVPKTNNIVLFGSNALYFPSQLPPLPEPFFGSDRRNFEELPTKHIEALHRGELVSPTLAAAAAQGGQLEIAIWVRANRVVRRPVLRVEGQSLFFDPTDLRFYEKAGFVALVGSMAGLSTPGHFSVVGPGLAVARLWPGDRAEALSVGSGRFGFDLNRQSHLRIEGLHIANLAGAAGSEAEGRAITTIRPGGADIAVIGNRFGPALQRHAAGVVHVSGLKGFRFAQNRMEDISLGAGFRATGRSSSDIVIEGNVIRRIGRTAIGLLGVQGATIKGNFLSDVRGVHGNAITMYLGNKDILVEGNCVITSSRPMTFHGDRNPDVPNRFIIRNNIFVGTPRGQAAINSWGASTVDVTIENNILAGPKLGLLMNKTDRDVKVLNNVTGRIGRKDLTRPDWRIEGNLEDLTLPEAMKGSFSEDSCSIPSSGSPLKTERSRAR